MESQPRNPEFRINRENFHPCVYYIPGPFSSSAPGGAPHSWGLLPAPRSYQGTQFLLQPPKHK